MTNNLLQKVVLPIYVLLFFLFVSCKSDDCSGYANSIPPYDIIAFHFIDKEGNNVQLDTASIEFRSQHPEELLENTTNVHFNGFSISNRTPIASNEIEIDYKGEKNPSY